MGMKLLAISYELLAIGCCYAAGLSNDKISAEFSERGLASVHDTGTRATYHFSPDDFRITIGGRTYNSASLPAPTRKNSELTVQYAYTAGPYKLAVIYELEPSWRFLSKQIVITEAPAGKFRLDDMAVFTGSIAEPIQEVKTISRRNNRLGTADYGACLRFERSRGLLVAAQNPFLAFDRDGGHILLSYRPEMEWDMAWGPFEMDRGLLAPYELSGSEQPEAMPPEWQLGPGAAPAGLDDAEVFAFTETVRAFLLYRPANPLNLMVGWCANDYQIDTAAPAGRAEYKRILDMAADVGAEHVLFAPANSAVSKRSESRDDWKWEYVLWLGMGQKIRRNEWDPATGAIPDSVKEMLDYAAAKHLGLLAYVYPIMGFTQNPEWLTANGTRANLGVRPFQDWLIGALEGFYRHTGITGYSFDHAFLNLEGASRYAQWYGWRRVLETLRRDIPDIVIDGRQAYQNYGPWTWLAGSYPHPTSTDEQPESFVSFPDLHLDRVSADRERFTAWRYRNYEFAPSEIVPGFITHQTGRNDDSGHMPMEKTADDEVLTPFRRRDWDYLGWKYSLLSSIAVAGWNNVIDLIPARDEAEFRNFSDADRKFFRYWIDWADAHKEYLRHTLPILGPPAIGKVDGTAAFLDDGGYLFLFNPNGRRMEATVVLDDSIGLRRRWPYKVRELYPQDGRLIGKPERGTWSYGDTISRDLDGGSVVVLEVERADASSGFRSGLIEEPELFNAVGRVRIDGKTVRLSEVRGEAGTTEVLQIGVPASAKVTEVDIDGTVVPAKPNRVGMIELPVAFQGARFRHYQQVDSYRANFRGGTVTATFSVPQRVFDQLAARRKAWPIEWTDEDRRSTWLDPGRLLLFVQIAEPDDRWEASLKIDGQAVDLRKAYASVRANRRNFTGFYGDLSGIAPEKAHKLELVLPPGLKPEQFQGVFFENVETEYTAPVR
jgi:hypothetical protein